MDTSVLEDLGLTGSEIKVYLSLLELGASTAGPIRNKTDLQNYIGITKIHDEEETKLFMTERMKKIRRIFSRSDSRNVVA